ncbi:MAG: DMT family transporter [Rhodobacteraceae bacterium]|nr:DMT family transporter [Paracoccaceae bacterium]
MAEAPLPAPPADAGGAPPTRSFLFAVGLFLLGVLLLDIMGIIVKMLLPRYGAVELSAYRNLIGMVPAVAILLWSNEFRWTRQALIIRQWLLAFVRGVLVAGAQLLFYAALLYLEFATVSALGQTTAIFVVALSVPILAERVGWLRWTAVMIGLAGAILIIRPGSDAFSLAALFPLGSAFCYALSQVLARRIDDDVPTALVYVYQAIAAALSAAAMAVLTTGFSPVESVTDGVLILTMGAAGGAAVLLLLVSARIATPARVAPFQYFGIISAFVLGYIFFGEAPVETLFPGVILIVASGLIILWRERAKRPRRPPPLPREP